MIDEKTNLKQGKGILANPEIGVESVRAEDLTITVLGVGGGGGNAAVHMANSITEVEFCCLNTDKQALDQCGDVVQTVLIGPKTTKGLGSGGEPAIGLSAAKESSSDIQGLLNQTDVCFIATGLGGGTGSGATGQVAEISRNMGILTIAVVTTPFKFEGPQRSHIADAALKKIASSVDATIVISNENLLNFTKQDLTLLDAFEISNNVILNAVQSISDLIKKPGLINIDFADLCSVIKDAGISLISSASSNGDLRAPTAIEQAIHSPLLGEDGIDKAKGIIVNITSGSDLKLSEYQVINSYIENYIHEDTKVILGTSIEPELEDTLKVTIILTGVSTEITVDRTDIEENNIKSSAKRATRLI